LVREGPIEELLTSRGRVRVRVKQDEVGAALARLEGGGFRAVQGSTSDDGWLSVAVEGDRASEINRSLAQAGIYASALTAETDLESVFLELTGAAPTGDGNDHSGRRGQPPLPAKRAGRIRNEAVRRGAPQARPPAGQLRLGR